MKKISRPLGPAILLYRVGYAFFSQKEQKPDEHHGRDEPGHGLAESEILLHITRGYPDHIAETHYKESEKDGKDLCER